LPDHLRETMTIARTSAIGGSSPSARGADDGIDAKAEIRTEALPKNARPAAMIG
jgi:hypothetical protein